MKKLGLIVNPWAGIGGKVGLKGSDGAAVQQRAMELGAVQESSSKASIALQELKKIEADIEIFTYPGEMGEDICIKMGFKPHVLGGKRAGRTRAADTVEAAKAMEDAKVDLLLFAGGDGTARDIMDAVGKRIEVLGIPAGCKIHSGVYAVNPRCAGELASKVLSGQLFAVKEAEVMDIDEALFSRNILQAKFYGYLRIPEEELFVQNRKGGAAVSDAAAQEELGAYVASLFEDDVLYVVGTGSTMAAVMKELGLPNTLLGVDLVYNKQVLAADCSEAVILEYLQKYPKAKILVTVIGGQGYIFGRGNQQLSAAVIRKAGPQNVIIAATKNKLAFLQRLYVDTGDEEINHELCGWHRVIAGYEYEVVIKVVC